MWAAVRRKSAAWIHSSVALLLARCVPQDVLVHKSDEIHLHWRFWGSKCTHPGCGAGLRYGDVSACGS